MACHWPPRFVALPSSFSVLEEDMAAVSTKGVGGSTDPFDDFWGQRFLRRCSTSLHVIVRLWGPLFA
jgi:hypothetical protein